MSIQRSSTPSDFPSRKLFLGAALFLVIVGTVIRVGRLHDIPFWIHNDESQSAIDGVSLFMRGEGGWALYGSAFGGHPNLSYWLSSIPARLAGELSLTTLRMGAALAGIGSIILLTLCITQAYGRRAALLSLVFITPFHLHLHYSRTGFPYIHAVLFFGLVSLAFLRFVKNPDWKNALLVGCTMGLGALAYPATHVLPFAMGAALLCGKLSPEGVRCKLTSLATYSLAFLAGVLITMGPQLAYSYEHGYNSRLRQTFILLEHNVTHLTNVASNPDMGRLGALWFNIFSTLEFFWWRDKGEQYQFESSPLPLWGWALALMGVLILVKQSKNRNPIAIYLLSTLFLTFASSALMVEASFTPHLILLAALIPVTLALGAEKLLAWSEPYAPLAKVGILIAIALLWGTWNEVYYEQVVSPDRDRRTNADMRLIRLPVDHASVKAIISAASMDVRLRESYYTFMYPAASTTTLAKESSPQQVAEVALASGGPAIIFDDPSDASTVQDLLTNAGKQVETFRYPRVDAVYLYVR